MLLTVREVAQRLGCCVDLVYAHIHSGRLAAVNISRKPTATRAAWRVPEEALERFQAES